MAICHHRRDGQKKQWGIAAVKTIPHTFEIAQELETLRILTTTTATENPHDNIVPWLALYPDTNYDPFLAAAGTPTASTAVALAFQYCPTDLRGTLEWRKRKVLPLLSFSTLKTIAADLFAALVHCHSHSIMHGDIKPGNLLVSSHGFIQLCDFGLAKPFQPINHHTKSTSESSSSSRPAIVRGLCTLQYRPPEILMGDITARHPAVDIFSAGLVLAELLTGRTLFPGCNELDQLSRIFQVLGTPSNTHWPDAKHLPHGQQLQFVPIEPRPMGDWLPRSVESPGLVDLLQQLMALDPTLRCTSAAAAQHPWIHLPKQACRRTMQQELIPEPWMEPIILAVDENHLNVPTKQILDMAAKRRSMWKDLDVWKEEGQL